MNFEGFTGPGYRSLSPAESVDRVLNYYFESVEVPGNTKTNAALYPRAGTKTYGVQADQRFADARLQQRGRALLEYDTANVNGAVSTFQNNPAVFGVSGTAFWQMNPGGGVQVWGTVVDDGLPANIVANAASAGQIAVISGGELYVFQGGTFLHIVNDGVNFFGARDGDFQDGYLIVLSNVTYGQQFQISALNDMTTWNAADVAILEGQADPIVAVRVNVEYAYFIGSRRGEIWYNTGNLLFPFTINPGAFLEEGTNAPASVVKTKGTVYHLGQDASGGKFFVKIAGLAGERISNYAVESAWSGYSTTDDCIAFPLTWNGHQLIRVIFPTADKGWEFDITETARLGFAVWNEIGFTDARGTQHAPLERAYCYAFGLGLVLSGGADGFPGAIYQLDQNTFQDCAGSGISFPLTRQRVIRLPYNGGLRNFLDALEFMVQTGVGDALVPNPVAILEISRDGGRTWGTEIEVPMGAVGQYTLRMLIHNLGYYRDGAIRLTITDPVFSVLVRAEHYIRKGAG